MTEKYEKDNYIELYFNYTVAGNIPRFLIIYGVYYTIQNIIILQFLNEPKKYKS